MGMACNVADAGSMAVHAVGLRRGSRVQICARYARPVWTVTQLLQHARPLRTLTLRDSDAFLKTLKYQGFELVSGSQKCQSPVRPGVSAGDGTGVGTVPTGVLQWAAFMAMIRYQRGAIGRTVRRHHKRPAPSRTDGTGPTQPDASGRIGIARGEEPRGIRRCGKRGGTAVRSVQNARHRPRRQEHHPMMGSGETTTKAAT